MTQLGEHVSTADEDLVERWEVGLRAKAEAEAWKTGFRKGKL